jgi:serine/threonine protein kinase
MPTAKSYPQIPDKLNEADVRGALVACWEAYIAMELRGEELSSFLARRGKLEASLAVQIAMQMLAALNATHLVGVIHRDLKPDNIFWPQRCGF